MAGLSIIRLVYHYVAGPCTDQAIRRQRTREIWRKTVKPEKTWEKRQIAMEGCWFDLQTWARLSLWSLLSVAVGACVVPVLHFVFDRSMAVALAIGIVTAVVRAQTGRHNLPPHPFAHSNCSMLSHKGPAQVFFGATWPAEKIESLHKQWHYKLVSVGFSVLFLIFLWVVLSFVLASTFWMVLGAVVDPERYLSMGAAAMAVLLVPLNTYRRLAAAADKVVKLILKKQFDLVRACAALPLTRGPFACAFHGELEIHRDLRSQLVERFLSTVKDREFQKYLGAMRMKELEVQKKIGKNSSALTDIMHKVRPTAPMVGSEQCQCIYVGKQKTIVTRGFVRIPTPVRLPL